MYTSVCRKSTEVFILQQSIIDENTKLNIQCSKFRFLTLKLMDCPAIISGNKKSCIGLSFGIHSQVS